MPFLLLFCSVNSFLYTNWHISLKNYNFLKYCSNKKGCRALKLSVWANLLPLKYFYMMLIRILIQIWGLPSSRFVLNQLGLRPLSPDPFCPFSTGPLEICPLVSSSCFILDSCHFVLDPFGPHPFRPWPNSPLISSSSWHFVFIFFVLLLFSSFSKLPFATLSPIQIVLYRLWLLLHCPLPHCPPNSAEH